MPFPTTRVVFVNGHFRPDLSDDRKTDKGVVIDSISHHLSHGPLKALYGQIAPIGDRLFTAMNMASPTDGLFILALLSPVLALLVLAISLLTPSFLKPVNMGNILAQTAVIAIVAMVLPGTDPISMLLEMAPLIVLFEASLVLARVVGTPAQANPHTEIATAESAL